VHRKLWVKATGTTVCIYCDLELVGVHPRLHKPGSRSTVDEHLPPEAIAYKMQDPQWCLRQAQVFGPQCHRLIRRLFAHRVLDNLRSAQGIISLKKKYGKERLEKACTRALLFVNARYRLDVILDNDSFLFPEIKFTFEDKGSPFGHCILNCLDILSRIVDPCHFRFGGLSKP